MFDGGPVRDNNNTDLNHFLVRIRIRPNSPADVRHVGLQLQHDRERVSDVWKLLDSRPLPDPYVP